MNKKSMYPWLYTNHPLGSRENMYSEYLEIALYSSHSNISRVVNAEAVPAIVVALASPPVAARS
jgi:hypothetical protein